MKNSNKFIPNPFTYFRRLLALYKLSSIIIIMTLNKIYKEGCAIQRMYIEVLYYFKVQIWLGTVTGLKCVFKSPVVRYLVIIINIISLHVVSLAPAKGELYIA